ncbi:MAG: histone deacetylase [Candidatus Omnitrophica bacterium]|nr:histone deacetylase [Candidatus Omnitrophota bacterium]
MKILYSEEFLKYYERGHPESPERVKSIKEFLDKKDIGDFINPVPCSEDDLLLAHTEELVRRVKENNFYDTDTPNIQNIYYYAKLSCGSAINAAFTALNGEIAFSLGRPPGHHASRNTLGGFCYFNNMAVAVKKVLKEYKIKIALLDIDGHHGNGTEEILKGNEGVIYVSLHQYPAFPGTGTSSFNNCYNFPIFPGSTPENYLQKFKKAIDTIRDFSPDLVGISLGFDAHRTDPLLNLSLEDTHYYQMAKQISTITKNIFIILEGGYNIKTVGNTCYCFLKGLLGGRNDDIKRDNGE